MSTQEVPLIPRHTLELATIGFESLLPAECCNFASIIQPPKSGVEVFILSTLTCASSCAQYGVNFTSLLPLTLDDVNMCVNQDPNVVLTLLIHASMDVQ